MRDFFLIKHHPRGLTEAYQENSRRTRAPRHTLPACAGRYDDEGVISLRQRVVNGMQSEGRVVSHLTERYCWRTYFKVLGVLFLGEVSPAFWPSKKACGTHKFRHFRVRQ